MKLSIQFHALPFEIPELFAEALADEFIFLLLLENNGRLAELRRVNPLPLSSAARVIIFSLNQPVVVEGLRGLQRANPDSLFLEIGELLPSGLSESWLYSMSSEPLCVKKWTSIANRLRRFTKTGALAINPANGASAPMKGHRFSTGAMRLFLEGVSLLPAAGNSRIVLPPSKESKTRTRTFL